MEFNRIQRLSDLIKERRKLSGECCADLWIHDIFYLTELERLEFHELKLNINYDQKAAKLRIESRILNKRRGRNDTSTTMQDARI